MNAWEAKKLLSLGESSFSKEELKKAFKKKMLEWHPDIAINKGVTENKATHESQKIILAYEIL